jgi:flagellar biosynthesis protein
MSKDTKKVVGIQYKQGEGLPKVILKGSGAIAEEIINKRNSLNSHKVYQDKELVKKLYRLPVDAEITKDLYEIVAIVLAHVFSVNQKLKETTNDRYVFSHTSGDAE